MVKKLEKCWNENKKESVETKKDLISHNFKIPHNLIFAISRKSKKIQNKTTNKDKNYYKDYIYFCPNKVCKEKKIEFIHKFSFLKHWRNKHSPNYPKCKFCKKAFAFLDKHEKNCSKKIETNSNLKESIFKIHNNNDNNVFRNDLNNIKIVKSLNDRDKKYDNKRIQVA